MQPHSNLASKNKKHFDETRHFFKCFFHKRSAISIFFQSFHFFFKLCINLIAVNLEIFILLPIIFCDFFIISVQFYFNFAKILDHLLRYDITITIKMFQHLFSKTDAFLLLIDFLTFLTSLIMTICKFVKKKASIFFV